MSSMRRIWVLMATVFVDMIGFLMVLPLLPFYAERYGASPSMIGAMVSTFAFAQLLTAPWWGRMSDRYGRRPMIIAGLLASGAAYLVFGLANAVWMLFLSRLIQGAGGGTIGVVQAYVADSIEPAERARALGWLTAATSAGVMIGPGIASLAASWSPAAPGLLAAALCLINSVSAWLWLPESATNLRQGGEETSERPSMVRAVWDLVARPRRTIALLIWIYALGIMAFMGMNGILALFLERVHDITTQTIGVFYMYVGGISLLMRALLLGPAVRWLGEIGVMRLGILGLAVGFLTLPMTTSVVELALASSLIPIGTALLFPVTTSLVSGRAPAGETGQILGVQQAFGGVARLVGPLWAGIAFQFIGIRAPFWICAAVVGLVGILAAVLDLDDEAGGQVDEDAPMAESAEALTNEAPS